MAGKLKANGPESDSAISDPKHNLQARNRIIVECRDEAIRIKRERKELTDAAGENRQRLKDAQIDTATFDLNVRIYEMEQESRAGYMDSFREQYEAMNAGDQIDWVETATGDGRESAQDDTPPSDETLNELRENGRTAGKLGRDSDTNPHDVNTHEGAAWHDGWLKGQKALADQQFATGQEPEPPAAA